MRAWLWLLSFGLGIAGPADVSAQGGPTVVVRADTRIELRVERWPDGTPHLVGTLRDDLGVPLSGATVDVSAGPDEHASGRGSAHPRTDADGTFDVLLGGAESGWWTVAVYPGDELYLGTEARQRLDLGLAHVSLEVQVADRGLLDLDRPSHGVRVVATSSTGGADLEVSLRNEVGVVLAEGRTDAAGEVALEIPSERLGPPSSGRLIARSEADTHRAAAQAEVAIVRWRPTTLTLERFGEGDERAALRGELRDADGPRAGEAVAIFAAERYLGTAATDEAGRFAHEVSADEVAGLGGEVALRARYTSDAPWIGSSESAPVRWSLRPPLLDAGSVVGALSLACVLAALALLRRRPSAGDGPSVDGGRSSVEPGERGRERVGVVSGRVTDARTGRPIAAQVVVAGIAATTDADGGFALEPPPGRHLLRLHAAGYAELETTVTVPHRGEHRGMRARLPALRDLALAPLRPIALRLLPSSELWSVWTQRELLTALRKAGREPPELAELIERVERACYAESLPADAELTAIRTLADRIEARLAGGEDRAGTELR